MSEYLSHDLRIYTRGTFNRPMVCTVLLRFPGWTTCFLQMVRNGVLRALRYVFSHLVGVSEGLPNQPVESDCSCGNQWNYTTGCQARHSFCLNIWVATFCAEGQSWVRQKWKKLHSGDWRICPLQAAHSTVLGFMKECQEVQKHDFKKKQHIWSSPKGMW